MAALGSIGCNGNGQKASSWSSLGPVKSGSVASPTQNATFPAAKATAFRDGWYGSNRLWSPASTAKSVSGSVKEAGSAVSGKTVRAYDAASGELLASTTSDGSGNFTLPSVGRTSVDVVAKDPTTYQAIVYDRVTPQ